MKKLIFALAALSAAATPLTAQPRNRPAPPIAGAHDVEGELVLFGDANFTGARQAVTRASPNAGTPFTVRSLSLRPGDRWQICANANFQPPCTTISRPIADATLIGVRGQIGSIRLVVDTPAGN